MVVFPFAISLPGKAGAGQSMLDNFHSMLQPASVNTTVTYFDRKFLPMGPVSTTSAQAAAEEPAMMAAFAHQFHMTTPQVQELLTAQFPVEHHLGLLHAVGTGPLSDFDPTTVIDYMNLGRSARSSTTAPAMMSE